MANVNDIYLPYSERTPDGQYQDLLRTIMRHGEDSPTRQGPVARTIIGHTMRFPLSNGFPIINERRISGFWQTGINELAAMINGVHTEEGFKMFGVPWWGDWMTLAKTSKLDLPPGDMGMGYGIAFHDFPMPDGGTFDQFANVIQQLRDYPHDRRHFISPWIPFATARTKDRKPKVTIAPCHGWVYIRILNGKLNLAMVQRSGDVPVGVPSNMVQYAALAMFVAHLTGFELGQYVHMLIDAHIYEDQLPHVETMLTREPRRLATVTLNAKGLAATDIHELRGDMFDLADYEPHAGIKGIPVAA